jgi:hypothetical protein
VFGLPIGGLAVANLKESQFGMIPCLQPGTVITEFDMKSNLVEVKWIAKSEGVDPVGTDLLGIGCKSNLDHPTHHQGSNGDPPR